MPKIHSHVFTHTYEQIIQHWMKKIGLYKHFLFSIYLVSIFFFVFFFFDFSFLIFWNFGILHHVVIWEVERFIFFVICMIFFLSISLHFELWQFSYLLLLILLSFIFFLALSTCKVDTLTITTTQKWKMNEKCRKKQKKNITRNIFTLYHRFLYNIFIIFQKLNFMCVCCCCCC
jgi:hypothetical protein